MKKETFNIRATAKILKHTEYKEQLLEARDLYIASESIEQLNITLQGLRFNRSEPKIRFALEGEEIKLDIQNTTYRIDGQFVSVENAI